MAFQKVVFTDDGELFIGPRDAQDAALPDLGRGRLMGFEAVNGEAREEVVEGHTSD